MLGPPACGEYSTVTESLPLSDDELILQIVYHKREVTRKRNMVIDCKKGLFRSHGFSYSEVLSTHCMLYVHQVLIRRRYDLPSCTAVGGSSRRCIYVVLAYIDTLAHQQSRYRREERFRVREWFPWIHSIRCEDHLAGNGYKTGNTLC